MVWNFDDSRGGDLHALQFPRNNGIRCEWGVGSWRLILKLCRDWKQHDNHYNNGRGIIDINLVAGGWLYLDFLGDATCVHV